MTKKKAPLPSIDELLDREFSPAYFWETSDQELGNIFDRVRNRAASDDESKWFTVFLMARFCRRVNKGEPIEPWILYYFADAFAKVASGGLWHEELPLPWMSQPPIRSATDKKAFQVYCDVSNAKSKNPNKPVTVILDEVAIAHSISPGKAKSAYYKWKAIDSKNGSR